MQTIKLAKNIIFLILLVNNLAYCMSGFNEPRHLSIIPTSLRRWWSSLNFPSATTQDPEVVATLDTIRRQRAMQDQFQTIFPQVEPALQSGEPSLVRTISEQVFLRDISIDELKDMPVSPYAIQLRIRIREGERIAPYSLKSIGKKFPNITRLDLSGTGLRDDSLIVLAQQPYASRLTHLNISNNNVQLTNTAINRYRSAFPNLVSLDISHNNIRDYGLLVIARQPFAPYLTYLNISSTRIMLNASEANRFRTGAPAVTDSEIRFSVNAFRMLNQLNISNNRIGNAGLALLAQAPFASELTSLNISHTQLTTAGVESSIGAFSGLTSLDISANAIGNRGLEVIADQPFASDLTLYLGTRDIMPSVINDSRPKFRRIIIKP